MTNVNETVVNYIAAWNERDPRRRRGLVIQTWSEDGSYIDAHRHGQGHDAIDAMLAATQAQAGDLLGSGLAHICFTFRCREIACRE